MSGVLKDLESEVARRLVHASGSLVPLGHLLAPDVLTWVRVQWLLVAGTVLALGLEVVRLVLGLDWWIYDHLTRSYEEDNLAGYALAIISVTAVVLFAPPTIAIPAIFMLTIGDPISGLLGGDDSSFVGKEDTLQVILKSPRALVLMFVVSTAIAWAFVSPAAAVLGGIAAMTADGAKPIIASFVIDDNLTIPLAGAAAMGVGVALL